MFCKKGVLKDFAKFTGKYLCQSLFFNKVAGGANTVTTNTNVSTPTTAPATSQVATENRLSMRVCYEM